MSFSLFSSARSNLPCLEFSPGRIKFCFSEKKKGRIIIKQLSEFNFEGDGVASAVEQLRLFLQEKKVVLKECFVLIPAHLVAVRFLKLPSRDQREIDNMLSWQVAKQLPYQPDEIIYSYQVVYADSMGFSHVMVFIAHRDIINRYLKSVDVLGARPLSLSLSCEALQLFYGTKYYGDASRRQENIALVEVGPQSICVSVSFKSNLHFVRGTSIQFSQSLVGKLISEVTLSFDTYGKLEFSHKIERVVISGPLSVSRPFAEALRSRLNEPVELLDFNGNLTVEGRELSDDDQYDSVIGLTLSGEQPRINLLPKETIKAVYAYRARFQIIRTLSLLLVVILLASGTVVKKVYERQKYLADLNSELHKLGEDTMKLDEKAKRLELVSQQSQKESRILDSMSEVYRSAASGVTLSSVFYEQEKGLNIRGNAKAMGSVFGLVSSLEKSPFFSGVQMGYVTKKKEPSGESVDFEIVAPFEKK